ncbi:MAG: hypothetical protein IMX04_07455 [Candidatus Carbobacillus altaicus]|uniref:Arginine decarboxylase n=1 Tax=Candidatus Carbonibacillus altaicus TaxID=2163959 RepID=A0A2R6Y237_9BACL|nr:hypothetical protein [Candidatus Carbobacillus altaicus]PTQ56713.1 MAG: Arginine decarboxylase [Candidatus Carbobacillus altaicus]
MVFDTWDMPLVAALLKKRSHLSFHVPAHKGRYLPHEFQVIWQDMLSLDQTELPDLDDLHHPEGVIAKAEMRAKEAFGVDASRFLVGGTTVGVLAAVLGTRWAAGGEKGLWIIQRDSHQSLYHALMLAGEEALMLTPALDAWGFPEGQKVDTIKAAIDWALDHGYTVRGLFLTSPNYYGRMAPLRSIVDMAHRSDIPVMIDAAHGGHLAYLPDPMPDEAIASGADLIIHSTHKTNGSLTMSSLLHYQGHRLPRSGIDMALNMLMSSSPSYVLMASLDMAQALIRNGYLSARLKALMPSIRRLWQSLQNCSFYTLLPSDDPLRLMIKVPDGLGKEVEAHLRQHHIEMELRHGDVLLFILSYADDETTVEALKRALDDVEETFLVTQKKGTNAFKGKEIKSKPLTKKNFKADTYHTWMSELLGESRWTHHRFSPPQPMIRRPLHDAIGERVAKMIVPYPPGIPLILPGERLSTEKRDQLVALIAEGYTLHGVEKDHALRPLIWIHA